MLTGGTGQSSRLVACPKDAGDAFVLLLLALLCCSMSSYAKGMVVAVAQSRGHAQRARDELDGVLLHDQDLKLGWGKAVTLPSRALNQSSGMSGSAPMAAKGDPAQLRPRSVHPAATLSTEVAHACRLAPSE